MTRSEKILISGLVVCVLVILILILNTEKPVNIEEVNPPHIEEIKQDSLFRDSINISNDSIESEIKDINDNYEKEVSIIMSSSDSANLLFFTKYIEDYNNRRAIEDSKSDIR
jgi:hypothetical protein|nr:MAG TPA: hypothetical protein [Bacteriophage sp.]